MRTPQKDAKFSVINDAMFFFSKIYALI